MENKCPLNSDNKANVKFYFYSACLSTGQTGCAMLKVTNI